MTLPERSEPQVNVGKDAADEAGIRWLKSWLTRWGRSLSLSAFVITVALLAPLLNPFFASDPDVLRPDKKTVVQELEAQELEKRDAASLLPSDRVALEQLKTRNENLTSSGSFLGQVK